MLKGIKETRRTQSQQRENVSKEREITKSNEIESVGLTSLITETEYLLEVFNSTAKQAEERISDPEDISIAIMQSEEQKEIRMKKNEQTCGTPSNVVINTTLWEFQERTERGRKNI